MDHHTGRPIPLGESGDISSEGGVVNLVNKDAKEGGSLITRVRLKLRVDLDDERGGNGREQTSLLP